MSLDIDARPARVRGKYTPWEYTPGTFGAVCFGAGLSWSELQRLTGICHTTLYRWAQNSENGRKTTLRRPPETLAKLFSIINEATGGNYEPSTFQMAWPLGALVRVAQIEAQTKAHEARAAAAQARVAAVEEVAAAKKRLDTELAERLSAISERRDEEVEAAVREAKSNAVPKLDAAVQSIVERMQRAVRKGGDERAQYAVLVRIGSGPLVELERIAWGRVWRAYCATAFSGNPHAHKTAPRGCEWYAA